MIRYPSSSISNSSFIASIKFVKNWEITLERGKKVTKGMDDDINNSQRRMSSRNHKVAALASADNRTQAALARLEALENDNTGVDAIEIHDDDDASLDDDDVDLAYMQKRQSKCTKRKTRQAKALENARKTPRTFLELLHEANLLEGALWILIHQLHSQLGKPWPNPRLYGHPNDSASAKLLLQPL